MDNYHMVHYLRSIIYGPYHMVQLIQNYTLHSGRVNIVIWSLIKTIDANTSLGKKMGSIFNHHFPSIVHAFITFDFLQSFQFPEKMTCAHVFQITTSSKFLTELIFASTWKTFDSPPFTPSVILIQKIYSTRGPCLVQKSV